MEIHKMMTETDKKVYEEELRPRLPKRIFDVHVHVFDKSAFPEGFEFPEKNCYNKFSGSFSLDFWRGMMKEILPEQEVWLNCFGSPHTAYNRNVVPPVNRKNEFGAVVISPEDTVEQLAQRMEASQAVGVKPYLNYAAEYYHKPANDVEIRDMMTPEQLEYLNSRKAIMTLHIPRKARFADKINQRQMLELCENYPNIRIIFAHIGRAYFMKNIIASNIADFVQFPNVYFDTAMINSVDILKYTYDHFPIERVLFGSDNPIALLHGKSIEVNNQYAYLTCEDFRIGTTIYDAENTLKYTTFFYEQLRGILNATPKANVEDVLFNNAYRLFTR